MKKVILYILAAVCIVCLSACGKNNDQSVGIIGGADGPTSVFVTDGESAANIGGDEKDGENLDKNLDENPGGTGENLEDNLAEEDLTEADLLVIDAFLNRGDVYGFLLSNYDDVLDADFVQVFYEGAGVGEYPNPELKKLFLDSMGMTEDDVLGDITYISAENADKVLQRVTGRKLSDLRRRDRDLGLYVVPEADGYFHMAGDTNRITVKTLYGTRRSDGIITVTSSAEYMGWDAEDLEPLAEFETVLKEIKPDEYYIISNHIIGGWMADLVDWEEQESTQIIYAEKPPFEYDNISFTVNPEMDDTLPCTLEKISEIENGVTDAQTWAFSHWDEWMRDPDFAKSQNGVVPTFPDADLYQEIYNKPFENRDEYFIYKYNQTGASLNIWNIMADEYEYRIDLKAYLSPDGRIDPDDLLAQNVRWARIVNGILFISNAHPTYAESSDYLNGYITAVNLNDTSVIWRSSPLVANGWNFELLGVWDNGILREGVIISGYGFTNEDDYIYQISMASGKILDKIPVATKPDCVVYANGILYVHCYDRDYEFAVGYG